RQRLLRAEANCVVELVRIVDAGDLERADADAVVRNAEPHVAPRQVVLAEERAQSRGELLGLAELAADDDARLQLVPHGLDELGGSVVRDRGSGELRRADLQADDAGRCLAAALRGLLRLD